MATARKPRAKRDPNAPKAAKAPKAPRKPKAAPAPAAPAEPPKAPHARCHECPAQRGSLLPPSRPRDGVTHLAVVGEAPCSSDYDNRGVFRSSGGRALDKALADIGLTRANCHLTNAILCDCRIKERKAARKACAPRLDWELSQLQPAGDAVVVVTFDTLATQSAIRSVKSTPIAKFRGSVSIVDGGIVDAAGDGSALPPTPPPAVAPRRLVLPLLHPAEVRKAPKWQPVWEGDWQRVERVLASGFVPPELQPDRVLLIPQSYAAVREALARLRGSVTACDIETVGLGPTETSLVCIGLSDGTTSIVVPWSTAPNGIESWWPDGGVTVAALLTEHFATRVCVGHNFYTFDSIVLARYGVHTPVIEDTILMTHALASHLPKNLPHVVTSAGIDVGPWKSYEANRASHDIESLWVYCGRDVCYTFLAYQALCDRLKP